MTEGHKRHDGVDHIWQLKDKRFFADGLILFHYECVCSATMTRVRYGEFRRDERS